MRRTRTLLGIDPTDTKMIRNEQPHGGKLVTFHDPALPLVTVATMLAPPIRRYPHCHTLTPYPHRPAHLPSSLFNLAQAQKVHRSAPSALDKTLTMSSNAIPKHSGMVQRQDVAET